MTMVNDLVDIINKDVFFEEDISKRLAVSGESKEKIDILFKECSITEPTSNIGSFYNQACHLRDDIDHFLQEYDNFCTEYSQKMPVVENIADKLEEYAKKLKEIQKKKSLIICSEKLEAISSSIMASLVVNDDDLVARYFFELSSFTNDVMQVSSEAEIKLATEKLLYFHDLLKDKFTNDFRDSLKQLNWPFISTSKPQAIHSSAVSHEEIIENFKKTFCHLIQLKLPDELVKAENPRGPLFRDWKPVVLPIEIMVEPLRKRFLYHFSGDRKTNRLDKPEWYMTQVITWIKDHEVFILSNLQTCLSENMPKINLKLEFMRSLMALLLVKVDDDLMKIDSCSDEMFSHLVDEVLSFDSELKTLHDYPDSLPCLIDALTEDKWFHRWLSVERKFATEKLDQLFASEASWKSIIQTTKMPECCDQFIGLLLSMKGRACQLRSRYRRSQFHKLQLELIDDFRLRLTQVTKNYSPWDKRFADVLNVLYAIHVSLTEWEDEPFYVEFWEDESMRFQCQLSFSSDNDSGNPEDKELMRRLLNKMSSKDSILTPLWEASFSSLKGLAEVSVLSSALRLYEHMSREMLAELVSHTMTEITARSYPYRHARWMSFPSVDSKTTNLALSPSAYEMFLVLRDCLHDVHMNLVEPFFNIFWQAVAMKINLFIYQKVVKNNNFNRGGAMQLQFDVTKNLIPLFSLYTKKPEKYFREVKESLVLLNLTEGSALLLKKVLFESLHSLPEESSSIKKKVHTDPMVALSDIGVTKLSLEEAELVLSRRIYSETS